MRLGFHLLLLRNRHRATLLCLGLRDILVRLSLIHLQLRADVLTYVDIRYINRQNLKCRSVVQTFGKHQLTDRIRILQHLLVTLGTTDRADDTFAYTGKNRVLACATHQLADVRANRHTGFGNQLNTVFCHRSYRRRIDHARIDTHLHSLKHVAACQINRRSHLERQIDSGFAGAYQRMYHALDMAAGKVMSLQSVTLHFHQTRLVSLDHTIDDLRRRHLTDAHQKELNQTDTYTAYYSIDP